jgi:Protein of unknown function DUF115
MPEQTTLEAIKYRLHCIKQNFLYHTTDSGRASARRLASLKDQHRGKRCFILGNGPSLRQTDLSRLRGEFTFGLNRIYLLFPELGFATTYLVTVNQLVIDQCAAELASVPALKFFPWTSRRYFSAALETVYIRTYCAKSHFSTRVDQSVWPGATVTFVAMQLAYHVGFEEVILLGVDHSFTTQGKPHTAVVSEGDDPNHFSPNYFGKGFKWQLPDIETSEIAYRMAKQAFDANGRRIVDATLGGKLTVFPKVDYNRLF